MKLINNMYARATGLALGVVATSSQAAIDVTAATTALGDGVAAVTAIGGAILAVWGVKKVFSMVHGG
jgi:hypothetical protein